MAATGKTDRQCVMQSINWVFQFTNRANTMARGRTKFTWTNYLFRLVTLSNRSKTSTTSILLFRKIAATAFLPSKN